MLNNKKNNHADIGFLFSFTLVELLFNSDRFDGIIFSASLFAFLIKSWRFHFGH